MDRFGRLPGRDSRPHGPRPCAPAHRGAKLRRPASSLHPVRQTLPGATAVTTHAGRTARAYSYWLLIGGAVTLLGADGPATTSRRAVEPMSPVVPGAVVA